MARGLALLAALATVCARPPAAADEIAYVGATVIDVAAGEALPDAAVVVRDGRIAAVGPAAEMAIADGARRVDLAGAWLIPGLIDAHVHLAQSGGLYTRPDVIDLRRVVPYEAEIEALRKSLDATLTRMFAAGLTGIVDMGGPSWLFAARARAETAPAEPRIALVGNLIATWAPEELASDDPAMVRVDNPAQARAEVRRQAARRPDLVKIWFVRNRGGQDFAAAKAWVRAAIDEAHGLGLRVAVHATEAETALAALAAGADVLVHSVDDSPVTPALIAAARARGAIYIPTLGVYDGYWRVLRQALDLGPFEARYGDPRILDSLDDLSSLPAALRPAWLRFGPAPPINPVLFANLARVHAAGIAVAAGSDSGNIGTLHGAGFHRELALMARAGLAPAAILRAATLEAARVMGRADELGSIAPGRRADMVVLDGDPLADIANASRIRLVIKDGVAHDPDRLLAALAGGG